MRYLLVASLLVPFVSLAPPASAGFETGADLLALCEDPDDAGFAEMHCLGYITAVADVLEENPINGLRACIPDDSVTVGRLAEVATAYLRRYPERGGYGAAGLVADALRGAWPCDTASAD
jgi:hypothetical protein